MTLAHNRYSDLFENGYDVMMKTGFWRLKSIKSPAFYTFNTQKKSNGIRHRVENIYEDVDKDLVDFSDGLERSTNIAATALLDVKNHASSYCSNGSVGSSSSSGSMSYSPPHNSFSQSQEKKVVIKPGLVPEKSGKFCNGSLSDKLTNGHTADQLVRLLTSTEALKESGSLESPTKIFKGEQKSFESLPITLGDTINFKETNSHEFVDESILFKTGPEVCS